MNNDEVEKNIIEAIEILGKVVTHNFKVNNQRITDLYEAINGLHIFELPKEPEPTATNHRGNNTVGPGIIKKEVPILDYVNKGKIPDSYKIAKKGCKWCEGVVAWPRVFVTDKEIAEEGKVREGPIHCDIDGNIKGDGRCPNL